MRAIVPFLVLAAGIGIGNRVLFGGGDHKGAQVPTNLYVAVDSSSPDEEAYAKAFLDGASRKVKHYERLSLTVLEGDESHPVYSDAAKREAVEEVIESEIVERPASDAALGAALQQIRQAGEDLHPGEHLTAVIVTAGTSDSAALEKLSAICSQIPRSGAVTLYIAGVTPTNRQALAPIFHSIRANAQVLGASESELRALLNKL